MRVAVRPRPVRNRRERLLVKFCGGEEKRFGCVSTLHPSRPEGKTQPLLINTMTALKNTNKQRQAVEDAAISRLMENVDDAQTSL